MIATARNATIKRANGNGHATIVRELNVDRPSPKAAMPAELQVHPLGLLPPPLSEADLEAMEMDCLAVGIRDEIVCYEGKILDGRHKYGIARKHGLTFRTREYDEKTEGAAFNYVMSKSLGRNMDGSQKATAAVLFDETLQRMGKQREWSQAGETATDVMGKYFGVSGRYIRDAMALRRDSPDDLFLEVYHGRSKLKPALSEYQRRVKMADLDKKATEAKAIKRSKKDWELHVGDCLEIVPRLDIRPSLIFTDPPYNLGLDYGLGKKLDLRPEGEYLKWCASWIVMLAETLADDGTIAVMIDNRHQAHFWMFLAEVAGLHFRNTILWCERFGNYTDANFTPSFRFVHVFTKHKSRYTWNGDAVRIDSDRITVYGDKRAKAEGKVPGNVWAFTGEDAIEHEGIAIDVPRLVGNATERMNGRFPTQLSLAGVDRIVRACSNPGELVLDPFNGSGTTGEAAILNGRRYVGVDLVPANVEWAEKRLAAVGVKR
jgi:DNA modification methylase